MPLFTLVCKKCNMRFEYLMNSNDSLPRCPKCLEETEKEISHPAPPVMNRTGGRPKGIKIDNDVGITTRIPHYADRNTGKSLGFGIPEARVGC